MIKYAAIKRSDGVIVTDKHHAECIKKSPFGTCKAGSLQGFLTSDGRFVERDEAGKIAWEAGQLKSKPKKPFLSEHIWSDGNCIYDPSEGYLFK